MIGLIMFNFWWLGWLSLSNTDLNPLLSPSILTQFIFLLWVFAFNLGAGISFFCHSNIEVKVCNGTFDNYHLTRKFYLFLILIVISVLCLLYKSGAFSTNFHEYFLKLRGKESVGNTISSGFFAYYLKFICYSIGLALVSLLFANIDCEKIYLKLFGVVVFFFGVSYYFQVNYPIMTLAYIVVIAAVDPPLLNKYVKKRKIIFFISTFLLALVLIFSAFNRYGSSDFMAVMNHYLISYNTLGFVFLEYKLNDVNSIIHNHTFGLSIFGSVEYVVVYMLNMLGDSFSSFSSIQENVNENMNPLYLSKDPSRGLNAFGTIIFTLYRDFGLFGVAILGTILGYLTFKLRYLGKAISRTYYACYIFFLQSFIAGIGVSPFDFPYFWSTIIFIFLIGMKFKITQKRQYDRQI